MKRTINIGGMKVEVESVEYERMKGVCVTTDKATVYIREDGSVHVVTATETTAYDSANQSHTFVTL